MGRLLFPSSIGYIFPVWVKCVVVLFARQLASRKCRLYKVDDYRNSPTTNILYWCIHFFYRWPATKLFLKESILLNAVLVDRNVQTSIVFDQSCANCFESVRGILCFLRLSHLLYVIWVKIFNMNRYISKGWGEGGGRGDVGAALVSAITVNENHWLLLTLPAKSDRINKYIIK